MLQIIFQALVDRLETLGFAEVGSALQDTAPRLPAARLWLHSDKEVADHPSQLRLLTWHVQILVGHDSINSEAQGQMHGLLDSLRTSFAGWTPTTVVGIQNRSVKVPEITILDYQDHGNTEYLAKIVMRVIPDAVAAVAS